MRVRKVAVVGGGPGGLYAARLAKLADPACAVTVYEQGEPDTTFGFGVGLAAGTQRKLEAADPDSLHDLVAAGRRHDMTLDMGGPSAAESCACATTASSAWPAPSCSRSCSGTRRRPGWRWSSAAGAARPIWTPTWSSPPTG